MKQGIETSLKNQKEWKEKSKGVDQLLSKKDQVIKEKLKEIEKLKLQVADLKRNEDECRDSM